MSTWNQRLCLWGATLSLLCITPQLSSAEEAEAPPITSEELRSAPERFLVAELGDEHYVVVDRHIKQLGHLTQRLLIGRINALHTLSYSGSSGESSAERGLLKFSLSKRDLHMGGVHASLDYHHPSPKAETPSGEPIARPAPSLSISCPVRDSKLLHKQELKILSNSETATLLKSSAVIPEPDRPFSSHRLLRDDWGKYYFIEKDKDPYSGQPYRLWVGYRGSMKRVPVMTAADDTMGVVLVSQGAAIRLTTQGAEPSAGCQAVGAYWVKEDSRRELTLIPRHQNLDVIFSQLGIYDQIYLGHYCDIARGLPMPRVDYPEELPPPELVRYELEAQQPSVSPQ